MQSHNLLTITRGRTKKSGNVNMNVVCILGGERESEESTRMGNDRKQETKKR